MASTPDPKTQARRRRIAWIVAIAADTLQIVAFPLFAEGWLSPANDVLDVVTSIVLFRLLGWHPALLPTLVAELLPGVDLVPTWTAAVGVVALTRRVKAPAPAGPEAPRPDAAPPHARSSAEVVPDADARTDEPRALPPGT